MHLVIRRLSQEVRTMDKTKKVKELIVRMEICLEGEFITFSDSDINTWIKDLEEIRNDSRSVVWYI